MSWVASVGLWSLVSTPSWRLHPQDPAPLCTPLTTPVPHPHLFLTLCSSHQTAMYFMETTETAGYTEPWTPAVALLSSWNSLESWGPY